MTGRIGVGSSKSGLIDRFYAGDRPDKYGGHYGFMAYNAGTSWTSVGQHVTVSFPDERYDNGSNYSASNSRYYPAEEGLYWFSATIYTGNSDTSSSFGFMLAGEVDSKIVGSHHQSNWGHVFREDNTDMMWSMSTLIYITPANNVRVVGFGSSSDFYPGHSYWQGCRVR